MTKTAERPAASFEAARRAMIDSQLRTSGVNEPWVLAAFARVARERFVPLAARDAAYIDRAVALGDGRMLAAPLVHGRMLAEARPAQDDHALLVGDGDGYLAELLRPMVGLLDSVAPGEATGLRNPATYSLIVIDGAIGELPDALVASLREGGRLVTGLDDRGVTRLAIGLKAGGGVAMAPLAEIGIPRLPAMSAPKRWSF
jgi:protein-L-isoaspartate(D-aspartate) O-methyltransferase